MFRNRRQFNETIHPRLLKDLERYLARWEASEIELPPEPTEAVFEESIDSAIEQASYIEESAAFSAEPASAIEESAAFSAEPASFIEESAVPCDADAEPCEAMPTCAPMPAYAPQSAKKAAHRRKKPDGSTAGGFFKDTVFSAGTSLDDILRGLDDTFQESLLKLIDAKGLKDAAVYKDAGIDRRHFSKIRSNADYHPKKQTALALCLALRLNLDETLDLIGRAGYALSPGSRADLIVRYCIENEIFDLYEVNGLLFHYDQPLLGE